MDNQNSTNQLDQILSILVGQQKSIDGLNTNFKTIDAKIEALDAKIDAKIETLDAKIDAKIEALDAKVETLNDKFDSQQKSIEELKEEMHTEFSRQGAVIESIQDDIKLIVEATVPEFEKRAELEHKVEDIDTKLVQHNIRITKLETA